jgi:hypothetical protein
MVATLVALLAQAKASPVMVFPLLSLAVAVNCWVAFTAIDGEAGVTVIVATVGVGGVVTLDPPPPQFRRRPQVMMNKARNKVERGPRLGDHPDTERVRAMPASTIPGTPI